MNKKEKIQEKIEEVKKGCEMEVYIGNNYPNEICGLGCYCPACQAKLETWQEALKLSEEK